MKTILIVEDEYKIAEIAGDYLRRAGYGVVVAGNGATALQLVRERHPDLIVLDLGLPKVDGLEVTRTVRRESAVPIIMLTARVEEDDRLLGLELGADDYITKPFSPRELVARVQAVLRRASGAAIPADVVVRLGDLTLDTQKRKASRAGESIELTITEFELLATMARQPGRVFTRAQLLDSVRGHDVESFDRAIDAHVKNIRRKIEPDPRNPRYIETVYGIGYRCADA
jgi:two-component system, OmpR family, alkaline phosphatase synthesis response regulator PhoP